MSEQKAPSKHFARALITLQICSRLLDTYRRLRRSISAIYEWIARHARKIEGWLKFNPIAVLLLFPLVATPARFAKSQRKGLGASLLATTALLWAAAESWTSAMQELTAKSVRTMEGFHPTQMDEIAKQQLELMLSSILGKPMGLMVAASIFLMGCCRAAWYQSFMGLYHRSRKHRPIVGIHYFLVQSSSKALYLGIPMCVTCFAINNWAWLEAPTHWLARSGYLSVLVLIFGLAQNRYSRHKARVDKQLYGSWLAQLISTLSSLIAVVLIGCTLMWPLGLSVRHLGPSNAT